MSESDNKCVYTRLSPLEHVLERPSMYIGHVQNKQQSEYLVNDHLKTVECLKIQLHDVENNEGLIKIYAEILSNASDNWIRSAKSKHKVTNVDVAVDKQTGLTTISNNGLAIRFDKDGKTGIDTPEMIFGHLLTSSNYTSESRTGAGVYGIGAKATNIFSKQFNVLIRNKSLQKEYSQNWSDNMKHCSPSEIKHATVNDNLVQISWTPDFNRFSLQGYSDVHLRIMYKMAIDLSMTTGVCVTFNGHRIMIPDFSTYVKLYIAAGAESGQISFFDKVSKSCMVLCPSLDFDAITFVNGLLLKQGVHVKAWVDAVLKPVMDTLNAANKAGGTSKSLLNLKEVQSKFQLFIRIDIENPEFANASKSSLTGPPIATPIVPKSQLKQLMSWPNVLELKSLLDYKSTAGLRKLEKDTKFVKVEGYEAANLSRTKRSQECSLLICEGLSAKTFCVKGLDSSECLGKKGRDYFGILPQKGKGLNVLNAPAKQIQDNTEIKNLIQVLGLKQKVDYTQSENRQTLHYGRVILMTDSDCDGSHISGLIITFFNTMYPSLVKTQNFIYKMQTPIITIKVNPTKTLKFYNLFEARKYIKEHHPTGKSVSYLKGLGSSSDTLIKEIFGKRMNRFTIDEITQDLLIKAFHKDCPDVRKTWLQAYDQEDDNQEKTSNQSTGRSQMDKDLESLEARLDDVCISNFIKTDMVEFSIIDCKRSIPSVFDGLKESQRKTVYTCFEKNLTHTSSGLKTSQLAGAIAELTNFKYGEVSLYDTIYRLGQNFVGTNNINVLDPSLSQFGSRSEPKPPAARYTKTRLSKLASYIFRKEDYETLTYINDEGMQVEPEYYMPIIPMILVNGCNGIGVGFSSSVPNFNPLELIELLKNRLDNLQAIHDFPSLVPWYRGFQGDIQKITESKFEVHGKIINLGNDTFQITEIPVNKKMSDFAQELQQLHHSGEIKRVLKYCKANKVDYHLVCHKDGFKPSLKNMKLVEYLHTSNMVLFGKNDRLCKYTVDDIFNTYFSERLDHYDKRLSLQRRKLKSDLATIQQRYLFIKSVVDGTVVIYHQTKFQIIEQIKNTLRLKDEKNNNFQHLLNVPALAFSKDEIAQLDQQVHDLQASLDQLEKLKPEMVWKSELDELETQYRKFLKNV